jgi:ubiquinone/menaquinone biosynthesis C-methylase UbiE
MTTQATPIAFSGSIPAHYDQYLGPMFFEPFAIALADRIGRMAPSTVLELAAGTGRLTRYLPAVLKKAAITATDINPAMVKEGQEKVQHPAVTWQTVDAVTLPYNNASYECIAAQFGVMFYSDRPAAYREALRVLQPGGAFIFSTWENIALNPMAAIANDALKHFFPVDTPAFYSVPFSYHDADVIRRDLSEAGFVNINIESVSLTGTSPSAYSAAKGLIEGTPTITAVEEREPALVPELLNYIELRIIEKFGKENLQVPLCAFVVTAFKNK